MPAAIKVENLSKAYQLGEIGTGTLQSDLKRWYAKARGREDPFLKIGEVNDRTTTGNGNIVWSLKDINFEIEQGDAVGIIGRNGAGKSTLLKILSRITSPTTGSIRGHGRIASLLEVGTGFHPDLTGKENIYLNGAILGMRKKEISRKFDAIVDFAGVERYINTPVKRYSSGMYVRLAFAVAAYLESEILIVDEVLAVGDAEFQKKCLGKMNEVSKGEGRTVLFVSHNMESVSVLTNKSIFLENGIISKKGETDNVIKHYLNKNMPSGGLYESSPQKTYPSVTKVKVLTSEENAIHCNGKILIIEIDVHMPYIVEGMSISFQIFNEFESSIIFSYLFDVEKTILRSVGISKFRCSIPNCRLYQGSYYLKVHLAESKGRAKYQEVDKICAFDVVMMGKVIEWGWQKGVCIYTENFFWEEIK